jgi:hypothetical protein
MGLTTLSPAGCETETKFCAADEPPLLVFALNTSQKTVHHSNRKPWGASIWIRAGGREWLEAAPFWPPREGGDWR